MKFKGLEKKFELPTTMKYICLMIFLLSLGEGMTAPAIPLYGDRLGASYSQLGFLMTGYSITYTLMTLTSGRFSDKVGRKNILLFSLVLSITASTGYYFSTTPLLLLVFRSVEGMSRGILWTISEAIVADNTTLENRSFSMGRFTASYGAGATIGTLSGGYIMEFFGLRAVFPFYPLFGIIVLITSIIGISEVEDDGESNDNREIKLIDPALWREFKKIWSFCYIGFCYAGFLYSIWGLLSMVADSYNVASRGIGSLFAFFWGARLVSFILSGRLARLIGKKRSLVLGIIFSLLSLAVFFAAGDFFLLALGALMGGIGTGLTFPVLVTLVADTVDPAHRGFGTGLLEFFMGTGMIIQTAMSGILGEIKGVRFTYVFTLLVTMVAVVVAVKKVRD